MLVTPRPGHFLGDPLQHVFQSYGERHYAHLVVFDPFGRFVFENLFTGNGGSAYVGQGYGGCGSLSRGQGEQPCRAVDWFLPFG